MKIIDCSLLNNESDAASLFNISTSEVELDDFFACLFERLISIANHVSDDNHVLDMATSISTLVEEKQVQRLFETLAFTLGLSYTNNAQGPCLSYRGSIKLYVTRLLESMVSIGTYKTTFDSIRLVYEVLWDNLLDEINASLSDYFEYEQCNNMLTPVSLKNKLLNQQCYFAALYIADMAQKHQQAIASQYFSHLTKQFMTKSNDFFSRANRYFCYPSFSFQPDGTFFFDSVNATIQQLWRKYKLTSDSISTRHRLFIVFLMEKFTLNTYSVRDSHQTNLNRKLFNFKGIFNLLKKHFRMPHLKFFINHCGYTGPLFDYTDYICNECGRKDHLSYKDFLSCINTNLGEFPCICHICSEMEIQREEQLSQL